MTLVIQSGWNGLTDPDAVSYVAAVEAADGEELEYGVAKAINDFVLGCKTDGIWDAIKACCILAGARTLSGALVPLVGAAPTNNNFVEGDYNRETGLVGDGSTKYLNSNRANNADPQNSNHNALHISTANSSDPAIFMGNGTGATAGNNRIVFSTFASSNLHFDSRSGANGAVLNVYSTNPTGFVGHSRSSSSLASFRVANTTTSHSMASVTPTATNVHVFSRELGGVPTNARIAFYSIGESLDLEKLDNRVTRLMNLITYTQTAGLPDLATMDIDAAAYIGGGYRVGGTLS